VRHAAEDVYHNSARTSASTRLLTIGSFLAQLDATVVTVSLAAASRGACTNKTLRNGPRMAARRCSFAETVAGAFTASLVLLCGLRALLVLAAVRLPLSLRTSGTIRGARV